MAERPTSCPGCGSPAPEKMWSLDTGEYTVPGQMPMRCAHPWHVVGERRPRKVLVHLLVNHRPTESSACRCGGVGLGRSWPEHVADLYEEALYDETPGG